VGKGGGINIQTGSLSVSNGARPNASSEGNGAAGNIEVSASSIRLNKHSSFLTPQRAGNINLRSQDLVLRRGSNIITNATGTATGGNITIDTGVIAALSDSDISANARPEARGQNRRSRHLWHRIRNQDTPESDITATSALGLEFSGTVEINTPDVDPSRVSRLASRANLIPRRWLVRVEVNSRANLLSLVAAACHQSERSAQQ